MNTELISAEIEFENASGQQTPNKELFKSWAYAALSCTEEKQTDAELSIRIVDEEEMTQLNSQFREQDKSTNVLSFPADIPAELELNILGDIAICAPVIEREATEQHKVLEAHYAHMTVHGTLHLLGHDHIKETDAEQMEALETLILNNLGYGNPYQPNQNAS